MKTKTMIILGSIAAAGLVLASQRKKIAALLAQDQADQKTAVDQAMQAASNAAAMMPFGADAPQVLQTTAATTQSAAQIVNTTVTTLAGIAGLAITMMTLTEKRRALAK
jgi:hypothetical protein